MIESILRDVRRASQPKVRHRTARTKPGAVC